ncbi:ATP-binding protein [Acutalibacter caecimuris]|uniref:ATP-binding protein n=1 Tax=Acutalibacter caecimuris TaxID=3093657 RepID=UPI002AC98D64|nr:ATP-binding protein [Acutalibacter sp. M00118]
MTEEMLELLEDIQDGDYVCVRWGNPQIETEGIIRIGTYSLRIQNMDGEPTRIRLNELSGITKIIQPENSGVESFAPTAPIDQSITETDSSLSKTSKKDGEQKKEFVPIPPYQPYSFSVTDQIATFKISMKKVCSRKFCQESNGILAGMTDAIKNRNQFYKYGSLRQKALQLWVESCEKGEDYEHFYKLLGILAVSAETWSDALEPFVRARCYLSASYAAAKLGDQTQEDMFYLCALLNKETGTTLNQRLVDICIQHKDITPFEFLSKYYKDDTVLDSCVAAICAHENCLLSVSQNLSGSKFVDACIQALPISWRQNDNFRSKWIEFDSYSYPVVISSNDENDSETEYVGSIRKFDTNKGNWGFVGEFYFHISQVCDSEDTDILLRKLLLGNRGVGLNVRYYLGKSQRPGHIGEPVATDIILDKTSFEEAKRRLEEPVVFPQTGYIAYYDTGKDSGTLFSRGKRYYFSSHDVRDPYLRAYCLECLDFREQEVIFTPTSEGGFPKNIRWLKPREELMKTYAENVTLEQKNAWSKFLQEQDTKLPDDQECLKIKFNSLESMDSNTIRNETPLTWFQSKAVKKDPQKSVAKETISRPAIATPQIKNVQATNSSTLLHSSHSGQSQHREISRQTAQQAIVEGRLDIAEDILNKLLKQNNSNEIPQIIGMLILIYLRQPEKMGLAKELLKQYEGQLPQDKQINLRISILEKTKDDDEELCKLYEESISLASTPAQKAHRLLFMGSLYMRMENYPLALKAFQRWEKLYTQSRYTQDAKKMQGNVQNINRQKAICFYRTDNTDEAKRIAVDLVRLNPSDTIAAAILDDTLDVEIISNSDYDTQTGDEHFFNDDFVDVDSRLPKWIRNQIDSLDLSEVTSAKNIKDGRYIGSLDEVKKDYDRQINQSKQKASPSVRCKALLAAYKIKEQAQQPVSQRLCGRAIASWGHYMATQPRQMDTPRMAYLYALQLLDFGEQDWTDSYNAYLKSYFMNRSEFEDYIRFQLRSGQNERLNTDVFTTHRIRDELFYEFFVGIIYFVGKLTGKQFDIVADGLYHANEKLRNAVCARLEMVLSKKFAGDEQNFKDALRLAHQEFEKQLNKLCRHLQKCMGNILEMPIPENELEIFSVDSLTFVLTKTDQDRMAAIRDILLGMRSYFSSSDFENQADCLRIGISKAAELVASIQGEPTDFSYENILPLMDSMILKLTGAQDSLYKVYTPSIDLNESDKPHRTEDGGIFVYLKVSNKPRHQTADRIEVAVKKEGGVIRLRESCAAFSLRGGEERDIVLTLDVLESAIQGGSFSTYVMCRYAYNAEPDKRTDDGICEKPMTFIISSETFTRLNNPFRKYVGVKMDKEEMFFGRDAMIQLLVDKICDLDGHMSYGRAVAIYGQTRCGKSSLMIHLKRHLEEEFPQQLLVWDMQNIGDSTEDTQNTGNSMKDMQMSDFLYKMLDVGEYALLDHPVLGPIIQSQNIRAPREEVLSGDHPLTRFNSYMNQINRVLEKNNCIIVLFIDEFSYLHDLIKRQILPPSFMRFWKAFLQNNKVFALVAGQDDMPEFIAEHQNEFATMDLLKVTYLDEMPAKQLFMEPLKTYNIGRVNIDPLCADRLFSLTAGSAYLIIILCSALVDYLNQKQASNIAPGIFDDFLQKKVFSDKDSCLEEVYFEPQLQERGHEELCEENHRILCAIAELSREPGQANAAKIAERTSMEETRVRELTERLVNRQVIDREIGQIIDQNQPCFKIRVKLFEQWLRLKGE